MAGQQADDRRRPIAAPGNRIHFVTGRLAEHPLRSLVEELAAKIGFMYTIDVLPISVAALMTPRWILRHISIPPATHMVLLPGYVTGELDELERALEVPVQRGPRDLRRLPDFFGGEMPAADRYGEYTIEILAEINHAPRLPLPQILDEARRLANDGADVIDVGCEPGGAWSGVSDCVKALRDQGHRVSIDSFHSAEVAQATEAGAELVLSVNASNRAEAADWGCEVVVIPDNLDILDGLDETVEYLTAKNVPLRIDPVLEPIGLGFAKSLWRYLDVRRRYPATAMMMGIGNLTEMTDVDSAAVNLLLLGICQELGIDSVLTTQVINWARTSVRECDLARRLVHYAVRSRVPAKHVADELVVLRDRKVQSFGTDQLDQLAERIKDHNVRLFAEGGKLHALVSGRHYEANEPFTLFAQLQAAAVKGLDADHAFYLGFEMAKAATALTLDKEYRQDEALDWGYLTRPEEVRCHHPLDGN